MMIADGQHTSKDNHTITEWVLEESAVVVQEIVQRVTPAVRQAMTTLEAIEIGTQTLMQSIGRQITEALMVAPVPASLGVCRDCEHPLRRVDAHRPRSITGIFGDYHWTRPYAVCPQGHGQSDRATPAPAFGTPCGPLANYEFHGSERSLKTKFTRNLFGSH